MKSGYLKGRLRCIIRLNEDSDFHEHDLTKTVVLDVQKLSLLIILKMMILVEKLREVILETSVYIYLADENLSKMYQYFHSFLNSIKKSNLTLV